MLCEIAAGREDLREALLARIGRLGLGGRAKLSFVARERAPAAGIVLAVGFPQRRRPSASSSRPWATGSPRPLSGCSRSTPPGRPSHCR